MEQHFEWDARKAIRNHRKHGITFEEAKTVFAGLMFISVVDEEHSDEEQRFITIGLSNRGRLLVVAHTDREGLIRIISARGATKNEEKFYIEKK